jgi:raffinose/stachyose/melibiose transport system substrate-binding protein
MMYGSKALFIALATVLFLLAGVPAEAETTANVLSINRDNTSWKQIYTDLVEAYSAAQDDATVTIEYMEDEAFKQKLPTLLQSEAAPDLFFSWGGGVFYEQAKQGFLRDITTLVDDEWRAEASAGGLAAFSYEGANYGAPEASQAVAIWYNKDLAAEAGVDPTTIQTWDDFLDQVQTVKDAGLTPIVIGGQNRWTLHFYYSLLAMRIMGGEGIKASAAGENGGFDNEDWVRVGEEYRRLIALAPFQEGYLGVKYDQATGLWGDGTTVFHLMGDWDLGVLRAASSNGGLTNDQLGIIPFPAADGGKGPVSATFGGASGFIAGRNASDEAVTFLRYFMGPEAQERAAREGVYVPTVPSAALLVEDSV